MRTASSNRSRFWLTLYGTAIFLFSLGMCVSRAQPEQAASGHHGLLPAQAIPRHGIVRTYYIAAEEVDWEPRYNIAPSQNVGIIRQVGNPVEGERDSALKPNTIPL